MLHLSRRSLSSVDTSPSWVATAAARRRGSLPLLQSGGGSPCLWGPLSRIAHVLYRFLCFTFGLVCASLMLFSSAPLVRLSIPLPCCGRSAAWARPKPHSFSAPHHLRSPQPRSGARTQPGPFPPLAPSCPVFRYTYPPPPPPGPMFTLPSSPAPPPLDGHDGFGRRHGWGLQVFRLHSVTLSPSLSATTNVFSGSGGREHKGG